MSRHYERHQLLIISRARSFTNSTGHDMEDLISQGNVIYCKARQLHNPQRAKFSTFLYHQLNHGLCKYTKHQARHRRPFLELTEDTLVMPPLQFRQHLFRHHLAKLSKEVQEVVYVILNSPLELLDRDRPNRRRIRKQITQHLRKRGLSWTGVRNTFAAIQALAYHKCKTEESIENYFLPARKFLIKEGG